MTRKIAKNKLEVSVVGRYHSEEISRLLQEKYGLPAFPFTTAKALTELLLSQNIGFKHFNNARERWTKKLAQKE